MVLIMGRGKRTYLSAIDAGFRWTAAHRKVEAEVKSEVVWRYAGGVNSSGYGWSMFRATSKYRHFWQAGGVNGYGIHMTPRGTYFRLNGNCARMEPLERLTVDTTIRSIALGAEGLTCAQRTVLIAPRSSRSRRSFSSIFRSPQVPQ